MLYDKDGSRKIKEGRSKKKDQRRKIKEGRLNKGA